ncbi:MAG: hypothetical protein KDD36_09295 [Flavobacteriales bacterium]|nr:hypothetical protein [Flavobacteriales bacterium]
MNPLILANIISAIKKFFSNKVVLTVIALVVLIFLFKKKIGKAIQSVRSKKFDKQEYKDVNLLAQQYREAVNPSGFDALINYDGTDEQAIETLARQTKGSLREISDAYRLKYNEGLSDRLRRELSSEDFQRWKDIVT